MKLTVIGSGFAALTSLRELRRKSPWAEITVIAPQAELVYLPSLIWIPTGLRQPEDLTVDLTNFFRRLRITHLATQVTGVSENGRVVFTEAGPVTNDGLIFASGGHFQQTLPGLEHTCIPCRGFDEVSQIRDRLNSMHSGSIAVGFMGNPHEPSAMRGGPMFELLFGIDTLLRRQKRRNRFDLIFFTPSAEPGKRLAEEAPRTLESYMHKRGIQTHLGHKILGFEEGKVLTSGGVLNADLILFMPGMTGPAWAADSPVALSTGGLIKADAHCRVESMEKTYVAGDSGSFPGPEWQAKQAHMADLQAVSASRNLIAELSGSDLRECFRHEVVCILDTLSHGVLVRRTESSSLMLPPMRIMHFAKRFFEYWYLRQYR